MAKFVLISDPNQCEGNTDFRIHKAGCRDVAKHVNNPRFRHAGGYRNIEAADAESLVKEEVEALQSDGIEYTSGDFQILPCCHEA